MDAMAGVLGALRWWQEAGVDVLVEDEPRDWLRPSARVRTPATPSPGDAIPATLPDLRRWLLDPATLPELGPRRIDAAGTPDAGLMVMVEMPEAEDFGAGELLAAAAGRLFERMLASIGRDRGTVYLTPVAPARPSGGRLEPNAAELLGAAARRHLALVRPRALLLLGQGAARAFGLAWPTGETGLRDVNHEGTNVAAIATCHPSFLLRQPARKADAWRDLRVLMKELAR